MKRRPGRAALALVPAMVLFVLFGMGRVTAPVGAIGLVFDEPLLFGAITAAIAVGGAGLLFLRPVELLVARVIAGPARPPAGLEATRLDELLAGVGDRAGIDPGRLVVRVIDDPDPNAAAGASHLLFVTTGALELDDEGLEAILAHELGHHRGLHPLLVAVLWWLSLPGLVLAGLFRLVIASVAAVAERLGLVGRVLGPPLLVLLLVAKALVLWLFWLGDLLAARASRLGEYEADDAARRWGYGAPLSAALERFALTALEEEGRLAGLRATHPPLATRIARLNAAERPLAVPAAA